MVYADTDFFLALLKDSDWLKSSAEETLEKYRGKITTSVVTFVELAFIVREVHLDLEKLFTGALEIASCKDEDDVLLAAHYLKNPKVTVADAFHAAASGTEPIISSDSVFDQLGLKRIKLEGRK